ncbi:hypothetical protein ACFLUH_04035 [Chloroflexota bacterium]
MEVQEFINRLEKFLNAWRSGDRSDNIFTERSELRKEFERRFPSVRECYRELYT